jgi:uncharacterized protein involved in exopolysaccharide biosynthesis
VTNSESVSLVRVAIAVLRHRRLAAFVILGLTLLGAVAGFLMPSRYEARASFLPQGFDGGSTAFEAAAAQFGFAFSSGQGGMSPAFYVGLVESDVALRHLVHQRYPANSGGGRPASPDSASLIELWQIEETSGVVRAEQAMRRLAQVLKARADRETGLVSLSMRDPDPALARAMLERILAFVNHFNTNLRQSQAAAERRFVAERLESSRADLRRAESQLENFLRRNRDFLRAPELQFEQERLQREVAVRLQVVTSLVQAFERARMDEVRNTPVITIVDPPVAGAVPRRNWKLLGPTLGFVLGLLGAVVLILILEWVRTGRRMNPAEFAELDELVGETVRI